MWVSTLGDFEDTTHLGDVLLDDGAALAGLDLSAVPTGRVEAGLVGRWLFSEGQGAEVRDASGHGATGKFMNPATWGPGRRGSAVCLKDGSYVDFGDQPQFHLQSLTLEAWVKPTRLDTYASVVGTGYAEGSAYSLHLRYYDGSPFFELDDTQGKRNIYNPTDGAVTVGSWNYLVCTYDGQIMRVYLNGRELGPGKPVQIQIADSTAPLQVGILPQNGPLTGLVDEIGLYNRALSRQEVWQNYLFGKPKR
jgi:hypothetical protein